MLSADPDPDSFDSLDKLCDEYKIAIGIHPHGPQGDHLHRWYSADVILPAVKDHNALIGTCLDTGHLIRAAQLGKKLNPVEEVHKMGARNFGIHLKDWDNAATPPHEVIAGQGALDIPGLLTALRDVKFQGMISIEYEAKEEEPSDDVQATSRPSRTRSRRSDDQGREGRAAAHYGPSGVCVTSAAWYAISSPSSV